MEQSIIVATPDGRLIFVSGKETYQVIGGCLHRSEPDLLVKKIK